MLQIKTIRNHEKILSQEQKSVQLTEQWRAEGSRPQYKRSNQATKSVRAAMNKKLIENKRLSLNEESCASQVENSERVDRKN